MPTLVTRQQYFEGALEILSSQGPGGLQVTKLCKVVGASTGSFYNYFRNWKDFVDQFLKNWRQELTKQLIEAAELVAEPAERFRKLTMIAMGHALPAQASYISCPMMAVSNAS